MVDLFEPVIVDWIATAIKFAPVIGVLVVVAWDLRKQLLGCIDHQAELSDRLLEERLSKNDE